MQSVFRKLRLMQLDRDLGHLRELRDIERPAKGWLRAMREALGISLRVLAAQMETSHQLLAQQEKAEASDAITLRSLRNIANSLDFDLVYALVPRTGSLQKMVADRARAEAHMRVSGVEHSMALENQAAGHIDEAIEAEIQRQTQRPGEK